MSDYKELQNWTDQELMEAIKTGDHSAFEVIMRRHEDKVYRIAFRIVMRREESRDVAQDVFLKIWQNSSAWKPTAAFTTWLYRVTVNQALWKSRSLKIKTMFSLSNVDEESFQFSDGDLSPEDSIIKKEQIENLIIALRKLPDKQRTAVLLKHAEGLSVAEVAEVMNVTSKSAESLIYRAKVQLKKMKII